MFLVVSRFVPYSALAIYPFVIVKNKALATHSELLNHEKIHHRQQVELLILPFYLIYLLNYVFNLLRYKNHEQAYRQIVFEQEAFAMDKGLHYLNKRKRFAFVKWIHIKTN
ncbi:MAG: hypothetical protein IPH78_13520 [Bacteroidetes bacterium]|nr:hypothetical protein [Bacteroidota bacterium]